jgi:hypothetical protein
VRKEGNLAWVAGEELAVEDHGDDPARRSQAVATEWLPQMSKKSPRV